MNGTGATTRGRPIDAAGGCEGAEPGCVTAGCRFACAWALVDFDGAAGGDDGAAAGAAACCFAAGAADCAGGSDVMMLTAGMEAEFAKSTDVGLPDGMLGGSRPAADDGGAAAALVQDGE